ncbi:alpha/beta hydrolase [Arthrobacter sp. B2a2-09]|uniref:alpha/beta hydrolase n=1 Tax=Arthrobacter sp. B2a2-09 TaxID=2952822 RepID=UPI0022CD41E5|nr:alpha/beta hydrolase [Arthrobacter sp. B2a2-09]MCZ9884171.1 alpha/beta hydrolase [Arthrobacter sp. B2a2-09]
MTPARRRPAGSSSRTRFPSLRRAAAAVAATVSASLLLSGCVFSVPVPNDGASNGSGGGNVSTPDSSIAAAAPAGLESFYSQNVSWTSCEQGFQCANIKVPVDYAKPDGGSISIAAIRLQSQGTKKGSLLVNPGGPGASGYDFVRDAGKTHFTSKLRSSYDLVGFDPRGVKRSAPVTCLSDAERDASREKVYNYDTDQGLAAALADTKTINAKCVENSGPALAHIDTASSAKDMDILRAVLNDAKLNYLGFSYGTSLGATYASLFPNNVGKLALDGAVDPALNNEDLTAGQAEAFEKELHTYVADCQAKSGCPMTGSVDNGVQQIQNLIADVEQNPKRANDGRLVTGATFVSGIFTPLYDNESWPVLTQALVAAFKGDVSLMLRIADFGADRDPNGTYTSNTTFAFNAINCLDYPMVTDTAGMRSEEARLKQLSPTFGYYFAYGGINCKDWPYKPVHTPAPVKYTGTAPIVVIGTTGDPATPVAWAGSLRKQLGNASLVTWKGEGHTAYGRSNQCVSDAVDNYFVDGKVPSDGTMC